MTGIFTFGGQAVGRPGTPDVAARRVQMTPGLPYLQWSDGSPLQIYGAGDPEEFLFETTIDGQTLTQSQRIQHFIDHGGNSIYIQMVRSHGGDGGATHNPFVNNDPAQGIDQTVLDQWDVWFGECEAAEIIVSLFFYDDGAAPFGTGDTVPAGEQAFIDACVATFGHRGNIIWVFGEEFDKTYSAARASAFAAYLRSVDTYARPIAMHQLPPPTGVGLTAILEDDPNVDIFAPQHVLAAEGPADPDSAHTGYLTAFANLQQKQHLAAWEVQPTQGQGTDQQVRRVSWAVLMAGASSEVIFWHGDPVTSPATQLAQAKIGQLFFEATRFQHMLPDDARAAGETAWALAEGSNSFIVYSTDCLTNLGITGLDAVDYDLTWLDVETGDTVTDTVTATAGTNTFAKPGGILGEDVALYGVKA